MYIKYVYMYVLLYMYIYMHVYGVWRDINIYITYLIFQVYFKYITYLEAYILEGKARQTQTVILHSTV